MRKHYLLTAILGLTALALPAFAAPSDSDVQKLALLLQKNDVQQDLSFNTGSNKKSTALVQMVAIKAGPVIIDGPSSTGPIGTVNENGTVINHGDGTYTITGESAPSGSSSDEGVTISTGPVVQEPTAPFTPPIEIGDVDPSFPIHRVDDSFGGEGMSPYTGGTVNTTGEPVNLSTPHAIIEPMSAWLPGPTMSQPLNLASVPLAEANDIHPWALVDGPVLAVSQ